MIIFNRSQSSPQKPYKVVVSRRLRLALLRIVFLVQISWVEWTEESKSESSNYQWHLWPGHINMENKTWILSRTQKSGKSVKCQDLWSQIIHDQPSQTEFKTCFNIWESLGWEGNKWCGGKSHLYLTFAPPQLLNHPNKNFLTMLRFFSRSVSFNNFMHWFWEFI